MSFKRKYLEAISHNIFVLNSCSILYPFVVRMVGKLYVVHRMEHCYCIHGVFSRIAGILFQNIWILESFRIQCKYPFMNGEFQLNFICTQYWFLAWWSVLNISFDFQWPLYCSFPKLYWLFVEGDSIFIFVVVASDGFLIQEFA